MLAHGSNPGDFCIYADSHNKWYFSTNETFAFITGTNKLPVEFLNFNPMVTKAAYYLTKLPFSGNERFFVTQYIVHLCKVNVVFPSVFNRIAIGLNFNNLFNHLQKFYFFPVIALPLFFNKREAFFFHFVDKLSPVKSHPYKCLSSLDPLKTHD